MRCAIISFSDLMFEGKGRGRGRGRGGTLEIPLEWRYGGGNNMCLRWRHISNDMCLQWR